MGDCSTDVTCKDVFVMKSLTWYKVL